MICLFYMLLSTMMLYTHIQNYSANRTTNERFGRTKKNKTPAKKVESDNSSSMTSSIMSISDFDNSEMNESMMGNSQEQIDIIKKRKATKRKGCCVNCWKFATHTQVTPQKKLYKYLAEQSTVIGDS